MSLHRPRRPYSPAYARRQLEAAKATYDHWHALQPRDWRERADRYRALEKWSCAIARWERVLNPPPVPQHYMLPF